MRLVDEPPELTLRNGQRLLSVDFLDQRKLRRRKSGQRKAASPSLDGYPLALGAERDVALLRQRSKYVQQLPPRNGDITTLLDSHRARRYELHLEIRARDVEAIVSR